MQHRFENITAIVKNFERPECIARLLQSASDYVPELPFIVADDSSEEFRLNTPKYQDVLKLKSNLEYFQLPFDSGIGAGRNALVSRVKTPYFLMLDDDNLFTKQTNLGRALDVLENSRLDMVGGLYIEPVQKPVYYHGMYEQSEQEVRLRIGKSCGELDGFKLFHVVHNFFLAKTASFRSKGLRWNKDLKANEHDEFFFRHRDQIKATFLEEFRILHEHQESPYYIQFRHGRSAHFKKIVLQSMHANAFRRIYPWTPGRVKRSLLSRLGFYN